MYICMFFSNFLFLWFHQQHANPFRWWFYQVHIERYIYIETITKTSSFKIFITIDEQEWIYSFTFYLFRNGSGDISTQENEAVVHIVLVEVSISNTFFFLWNWAFDTIPETQHKPTQAASISAGDRSGLSDGFIITI